MALQKSWCISVYIGADYAVKVAPADDETCGTMG